jgi:hypothetical protein
MLFIFLTLELNIDLWQLKTAVFLHWCLICAVPLSQCKNEQQQYFFLSKLNERKYSF